MPPLTHFLGPPSTPPLRRVIFYYHYYHYFPLNLFYLWPLFPAPVCVLRLWPLGVVLCVSLLIYIFIIFLVATINYCKLFFSLRVSLCVCVYSPPAQCQFVHFHTCISFVLKLLMQKRQYCIIWGRGVHLRGSLALRWSGQLGFESQNLTLPPVPL